MRLRQRMTAKAVAIVCAMCAMCCLLAAGARADTGQGSSAEAFTALTQRILDEYYGRLDPDERSHVDDRIARLGVDRAGVLESARETSSAAVIISATASSQYMPIVLAAAAAQAAPNDPLAVNNFAAILRSIGQLDESIEVLLYAESLAPYSPVILTNLGNSYLDKGMLGEAQLAYTKAIAYDADFEAAHYGMSIIWVKLGNGNLAMAELAKAARGGFVPSMRQVYLGARGCGGSVGGPFWDVIIDEDMTSSQDGDGSPGHPGDDALPQADRLILPTLPKWGSRMDFLAAAPGLQPLTQRIMREGLIGALEFAAQYHPEELAAGMGDGSFDQTHSYSSSGSDEWDDDGWDDDESWGEDDWGSEGDWDSDSPSSPPQGIQLKPGYGQKLFMLELVNDYYADMIAQELTQSAARRKQIDERYEREMTELKEGGQYKQLELKTMANQIYEAKVLAQTINKLGGQIADSHFYAWRDLTLESYGRLKSLLLEYWKMSDQVTAGIYDQDVIDYVNKIRELTVYSSFLPMALDFSTLPQAYALADYIAPIADKDEDLSQFRPQPVGELTIPKKEAKKCGLKNKLAFGIGPASFAVDCDSWELEFLAGVGGSYKQNFKTGESEISVLVGAKAGAEIGPVKGELSAKGGVTLRFDKNGNLTGWTDKGEFGMKTGIGPLSAGQSLEGSANLGSIAGPRTETTSSLGFEE
ncbi:MAG: tetratricopeptide repeat protein [Bacillota bacterium]